MSPSALACSLQYVPYASINGVTLGTVHTHTDSLPGVQLPPKLPFPPTCRFVMNESAGTVIAVGPSPDGSGELSGYALWIDPTADGHRRIRRAILRFDHPALTNDAVVVQRQMDMLAGQMDSAAAQVEAEAAAVAARLGGPLVARWGDRRGAAGGGPISPVDFSGFHSRLIRLCTSTDLAGGTGWAYHGVTATSGGAQMGKVEAQWQQTPTPTLDSMVLDFEGRLRITAASRVERPGWAAAAGAAAAVVPTPAEPPETESGGEGGAWPPADAQPLAAPPPTPGGWRPPPAVERQWCPSPWASTALTTLPPPSSQLRMTHPFPPAPQRPSFPRTAAGAAAAPRTRRKPGALDATDPDSSAARRRQRNRVSAARSNERRRLRRLAMVAEAVAAAAAAAPASAAAASSSATAAGAGGAGGGTSSGGGGGGSCSGGSSVGDAASAPPPRPPEAAEAGARHPGAEDGPRPHWAAGEGGGGPSSLAQVDGNGALAGGGEADAARRFPLSSGG